MNPAKKGVKLVKITKRSEIQIKSVKLSIVNGGKKKLFLLNFTLNEIKLAQIMNN